MKIKIVLLATLVLVLSSIGFAQSKAKAVAPNVVVKNLYAAHKAGRSPFFQTKSRALLDKSFTKYLADLIWKDTVDAKGELGAIDFDPLYGSQDPQVTDFNIMETGWGGDSKFGRDDEAVVQVTFKEGGQERMVAFQFKLGKDKTWKIYDVHYRGYGDEVKLVDLLTNASAAAQNSPGKSEATEIQGKLQIGKIESVILYVGMESGDYAAYCFTNDSEAGRKILAACKDREQCAVTATVDDYSCKVPGLEADLSASGKIVKVQSVKGNLSNALKAADSNTAPLSDTTSGIRGVDFFNYSYQGSVCSEDAGLPKTVKVRNGKFKDRDNNFFNIEKKIVYGDVNGDGSEEAVVLIRCGSAAGTLRAFEVHTYSFHNGQAKLLAQLDSTGVESDYQKSYADGMFFYAGESGPKIVNGHVIVEALMDGSFAAPENVATFDYQLSGGKFVLSTRPTRKKRKQ
jgi:hypothetical protein